MTPNQLIRLLLSVRQMNNGQFWGLIRELGANDVLPPEPMDSDEVLQTVKKLRQ